MGGNPFGGSLRLPLLFGPASPFEIAQAEKVIWKMEEEAI